MQCGSDGKLSARASAAEFGGKKERRISARRYAPAGVDARRTPGAGPKQGRPTGRPAPISDAR
ncbi:hypothetical protein WT72_27325 [Burkholderia pseudomultivorans]|nr:hypothetical protein WT72_27325 [Burkholderia pseudomultivorans]